MCAIALRQLTQDYTNVLRRSLDDAVTGRLVMKRRRPVQKLSSDQSKSVLGPGPDALARNCLTGPLYNFGLGALLTSQIEVMTHYNMRK